MADSFNRIFQPGRMAYLLALAIMCCAPGVAAGRLLVRADQVKVDQGSVYLDLSVWNCSGHRVVEQLADLPWGEHAIGIVVYAAGPRAGQPLEETGLIEDFPIKEVTISPGSSVSGRINLSRRFPRLSRYREYNGLVLFWVYDLSLIQGGADAYVGGMLPFVPSSSDAPSMSAANPCD
ncbi:MAG: hypothetical protein ACTS5I_05340 [Rhodanobacter sp.]